MDADAVRAVLRHYVDHSGTDEDVAHEIYHADTVLEFPQSGERFEGVDDGFAAPQWRAPWRAAPPPAG